jgi:hypothetical protein
MRRLLSAIVLLVVCRNAWAITFSPSTNPNTTGNYTVQFGSTPTGCYNESGGFMDCYDLWASADGGQSWGVAVWGPASQGVTSYQESNLPAGTYDYMIVYYVNAFPESWSPVDWGQMTVASQNVTFSITNASATEAGQIVFTVTKSGSTSQTTGVSFATAAPEYPGQTATVGADFSATSGTLSFAWNEPSKTFTVNTLQDNIAEYQEAFRVELFNPTGPATIDVNGAGGIINDNDPIPTISISDATTGEDGYLSYTLTLSNPAVYWVGASLAFGGTAASGSDYTAYCCSVAGVAPLSTSAPLDIDTLHDSVFEGNETVNVTLSSYGGVPIGDGFGVGTIIEDDTVVFSINNVAASEGNTLAFTVTQTGASVFTHVVRYDTANNSATVADGDYNAITNQTLSFPPTGSSSQTLGLNVTTNDESPAKVEINETLYVNLSNGGGLAGATIHPTQGSGVGTINNDDSVSFTISDVSASEGDLLAFVVTRNGASDLTHAVSYATANGSATLADGDYAAASNSVSFPPSLATAPTQTVNITTIDETPAKVEASQTVLLNLSDGGALNGGTIGDFQGVGTITNDDSVSFAINDTSIAEGTAAGGVLAFTVSMSGLTELSHTVQYSTAASGTATSGTDYTAVTPTTLNFSSSQPNQTANVSAIADPMSEQH